MSITITNPNVVFYEPRSLYDCCIIGFDHNKDCLIYSEYLLIEALIESFRKDEEDEEDEKGDPTLTNNTLYLMACEWISYNMITPQALHWPDIKDDNHDDSSIPTPVKITYKENT